jgi:hypothetical protein
MRELDIALYAEGPTERDFLPPVIQRTLKLLIDKQGYENVFVSGQLKPITFDKSGLKQHECIQEAARLATDYDLLIIHCDADAKTANEALQERYNPGYDLVQQSPEDICKSLIPVVPIRTTEAWILAADYDLFKQVLATKVDAHGLGLVSKVKQVEADPDPKQTLKQVVQKARAQFSKRHRDIDFSEIHIAFGRQISLERLSHVPSYKQFVDDLTTTLKSLQLIS